MPRRILRANGPNDVQDHPHPLRPDDFLDAAAEAILDEPVRVGRKMDGNSHPRESHDWRTNGGVYEVEVVH